MKPQCHGKRSSIRWFLPEPVVHKRDLSKLSSFLLVLVSTLTKLAAEGADSSHIVCVTTKDEFAVKKPAVLSDPLELSVNVPPTSLPVNGIRSRNLLSPSLRVFHVGLGCDGSCRTIWLSTRTHIIAIVPIC